MAGIYIHIPFCKQACFYCDFHFSTTFHYKSEIIRALAEEIKIQKNYLQGEKIETIYFGGGTPSLLSTEELSMLLHQIDLNHAVDKNPEITLEANPDDLLSDKLTDLLKAGINRISIGMQSFYDQHLKFLHRAHSAQQAIDSFNRARKAGFENITIDLIYAIPYATHAIWEKDIEIAIDMNPEHISAYCLTIEPSTVLGNWQKHHKFFPANDEFAATQFEILMDATERAGYEQYEISNFARNGFYSRHNRAYWQHKKYLGIGPGAHSFNKTERQFNLSNNYKYLKSIRNGQVPYETDKLSLKDLANEYLLTTIRTMWGTDVDKLREEYQYDLINNNMKLLNNLIEKQLLQLENNRLKLTRKGKLLADEITADLFWV